MDSEDKKSSFSNFGAGWIDLSAPGEQLLTLSIFREGNPNFSNYYTRDFSGTSFSTALVSGAAALVKSWKPSLKSEEITSILIDQADDLGAKNPVYREKLGGRLNLAAVFEADLEPAGGRLIKLADWPAVYYLDQATGRRHLFPNQAVFRSWYGQGWDDQGIEVVSQREFDGFSAGKNVVFRPGTFLVKFSRSPQVYQVIPGAVLRPLSRSLAVELYGSDYSERLATIQAAFEADYRRDSELTKANYLPGSLIQYSNSDNLWYIKSGKKRKITAEGFQANSFQEKFIIKNVSPDFSYPTGRPLDGRETEIFVYSK